MVRVRSAWKVPTRYARTRLRRRGCRQMISTRVAIPQTHTLRSSNSARNLSNAISRITARSVEAPPRWCTKRLGVVVLGNFLVLVETSN